MFLFRQYLNDIYQQLKSIQKQERVCVFRGQVISPYELETLRKSIGKIISINSFFSTSTDRSKALWFLHKSKSLTLERILFEIDADNRDGKMKPFADISTISEIPTESEVLFMFGSIFRINDVYKNEDQTCIVKLTQCSDDEHELREVLDYRKQQNHIGETNIRSLGKLAWKMAVLI